MAVKFSNNAATTLAANVTNSATTITVADGSVFPTLAGTDFTFITLEDVDSNREIVKLTAVSSNTLTIVRAQDGSSARAYSTNDKVELRLTAALLNAAVDSGAADLELNVFSGTGSQVNFTLSTQAVEANTLAYIDGVYQNKSGYSISGYVLTFSAAPDNGATIEVTCATVAPIQESTDFLISTFTGNNSTTAFSLSNTPTSENQCSVYISGVYQSKANFSVSGSTLTFSTAPPSGSAIEVMVARTVVFGIGIPDDNTVSTAKIQDDAVTSAKVDSTVATVVGTETLTNKTLTAPDINTPDIDGGTIDGAVIGGATAAAGTFTGLTVDGTTNTTLSIEGDTGAGSTFINFADGTATTKAQISGAKAGASGGRLLFYTTNTSGASTEALRIDNAGHAIIGGGITLGNGQTYAAANTLDDYEEGTWTPVIDAPSGSQPSIGYSISYGTYTKVGRLVTLSAYINTSSISGTVSAAINITGLPFNQIGSTGFASTGAFSISGATFVRTTFGSISQYEADSLGFLTANNGASWNWETLSTLASNFALRFSYTYITAA